LQRQSGLRRGAGHVHLESPRVRQRRRLLGDGYVLGSELEFLARGYELADDAHAEAARVTLGEGDARRAGDERLEERGIVEGAEALEGVGRIDRGHVIRS